MYRRILILLLSGLLTAFSLAGCGTEERKRPEPKGQAEQKGQVMQKGQKRFIKRGNLTVEVVTPFVEPNPVVPPLEVAEEKFEPDEVMKWFFDHPEQVRRSEAPSLPERIVDYYSYKEPWKHLTVTPRGFWFWDDRYTVGYSKGKDVRSFSQEEAVSMAKKFIAAHGGLPAEHHLQEVRPIVDSHYEPDSSRYKSKLPREPNRYAITFTPPAVKGIPFYQNEITIDVTPDGVAGYTRTWRQVRNVREDKARPIISPEEALTAFLREYKGLAGDRFTLVYYGERPGLSQLEMRPIWLVWAGPEGNKSVQGKIDAYTGQGYPHLGR
ncbi:MAG: PepSY domain-containing protein [Bacillota bacterium]